jgi:hypothetical protein
VLITFFSLDKHQNIGFGFRVMSARCFEKPKNDEAFTFKWLRSDFAEGYCVSLCANVRRRLNPKPGDMNFILKHLAALPLIFTEKKAHTQSLWFRFTKPSDWRSEREIKMSKQISSSIPDYRFSFFFSLSLPFHR